MDNQSKRPAQVLQHIIPAKPGHPEVSGQHRPAQARDKQNQTKEETQIAERHNMTDNQTTPTSLLEVGDTHIQAAWSHPDSNTEIIGIYRFMEDDYSPHWVMDQPLRGPWSVVKDGKVTQDTSIAKQAFKDTAYHAMALLLCLSTEGTCQTKQAWAKEGGIVYDM